MILFFDTSGARRVTNWKAASDDINAWPNLIHLAWQLYDDEQKLVSFGNEIIKPQGFKITEGVSKISGVWQEEADSQGKDLKEILNLFNEELKKAKYVVSFNLNFNKNVLLCEYIRQGIKSDLDIMDSYCLMHESTYYCKLPTRYGGYKWPTLAQFFGKLYNAKLEGVNQADTDVIATATCFYKLLEKGELDDLFE